MFYTIEPGEAILSDINRELIDTYRFARAFPHLLYEESTGWPQWESFYYVLRDADPESLTASARAARFYYLNRFCFNGVYRTNRAGRFNVPRGQSTGGFPGWQSFWNSASQLRSATVVAADFEDVLDRVRRNDFVYLDPPYVAMHRVEYGQYGYQAIAKADLPRLTDVLTRIDRRGARFILSFTEATDLIDAVPVRWRRRLRVNRNVSGFAGNRKRAFEVLAANYTP